MFKPRLEEKHCYFLYIHVIYAKENLFWDGILRWIWSSVTWLGTGWTFSVQSMKRFGRATWYFCHCLLWSALSVGSNKSRHWWFLCCFVLVCCCSSMFCSRLVLWEECGKIRKTLDSLQSCLRGFPSLWQKSVDGIDFFFFFLAALTKYLDFILEKQKWNFLVMDFWWNFFLFAFEAWGFLWSFGEYGSGIKKSENSGKALLLKSARCLKKLSFPEVICSSILKRDFTMGAVIFTPTFSMVLPWSWSLA